LQLSLLPSILAMLFTDLFDSLSTFIGVANAAQLTDSEGQPINLRRGLIVDAFATLAAGLAGTSSGRICRECCRHPDGRPKRTRVGGHRAVLSSVLLHRSAGGGGSGLRDGGRARPGRTGDVPDRRTLDFRRSRTAFRRS
jgi:hypothetical protein